MAAESLRKAIRRLGYSNDEMTTHGFRAMARTILTEELRVREDLIEHQLSHTVRDPLGRAYGRMTFRAARHSLMQLWSDYLDCIKTGSTELPDVDPSILADAFIPSDIG